MTHNNNNTFSPWVGLLKSLVEGPPAIRSFWKGKYTLITKQGSYFTEPLAIKSWAKTKLIITVIITVNKSGFTEYLFFPKRDTFHSFPYHDCK